MEYPTINGIQCTHLDGVRELIKQELGVELTNKSIYAYISKKKLPKSLPFRVAGRAYWSVEAIKNGCQNLVVAI